MRAGMIEQTDQRIATSLTPRKQSFSLNVFYDNRSEIFRCKTIILCCMHIDWFYSKTLFIRELPRNVFVLIKTNLLYFYTICLLIKILLVGKRKRYLVAFWFDFPFLGTNLQVMAFRRVQILGSYRNAFSGKALPANFELAILGVFRRESIIFIFCHFRKSSNICSKKWHIFFRKCKNITSNYGAAVK